MTGPISPTLEIRSAAQGASICCRQCKRALAPAGTAWKGSAVVTEIPTDQVGCAIDASAAATIVRLFTCGGCGALLDSETALAGEPLLEDIVTR